MGVFDRQIALALRLIAKYGETSQFIVRTANAVDPATPWIPTGETDVSNDVKIVYLSNGKGNELFKMLLKSDVPTGGQRGLMAAVNFDPKIDSVIVRPSASRQYKLKTIDPIAPNGEMILYKLEFYA